MICKVVQQMQIVRMITGGDECCLLETIYFTKCLLATCFCAGKGIKSRSAECANAKGGKLGKANGWHGRACPRLTTHSLDQSTDSPPCSLPEPPPGFTDHILGPGNSTGAAEKLGDGLLIGTVHLLPEDRPFVVIFQELIVSSTRETLI